MDLPTFIGHIFTKALKIKGLFLNVLPRTMAYIIQKLPRQNTARFLLQNLQLPVAYVSVYMGRYLGKFSQEILKNCFRFKFVPLCFLICYALIKVRCMWSLAYRCKGSAPPPGFSLTCACGVVWSRCSMCVFMKMFIKLEDYNIKTSFLNKLNFDSN